jgi:hypothetical protein
VAKARTILLVQLSKSSQHEQNLTDHLLMSLKADLATVTRKYENKLY